MRGFERIKAVRKWQRQNLVEKVLRAFKSRGYDAVYLSSSEQAVAYLMEQIETTATVSCGGSATLAEIGIITGLEQRGNPVSHSFKAGLSSNEQLEIMKNSFHTDVYLCSANAVTEDGRLFFTDGVGNRVAAVCFGPQEVIIVVGMNKLVADAAMAERRIQNIAAPMNLRRYYKPERTVQLPPCVQSGQCMNCNHPEKACRIHLRLDAKPKGSNMKVVLIDEELGF